MFKTLSEAMDNSNDNVYVGWTDHLEMIVEVRHQENTNQFSYDWNLCGGFITIPEKFIDHARRPINLEDIAFLIQTTMPEINHWK